MKTTSRARWMRDGKFGLMVHWLAPGPLPERGPHIQDLNAAVNQFDVGRFVEDFRRTRADWLIFTIGQDTGYYASPNPVLDRLAGPGHCPQRDLVLEIAQAIKEAGARFIAYLPGSVSTPFKQAFGWTEEMGTAQEEFQKRYTPFIAEYSLRLGSLLDGWWFDAPYELPVFHKSRLNAALYLAAARAGNPQAAVAFNDGSLCCGFSEPVVAGQDYLAGETEVVIHGKIRYGREKEAPLLNLATHTPQPPSSCMWHALVPIDCFWMHGQRFGDHLRVPFAQLPVEAGRMEPPVYATADLATLLHDFKAVGGGVTFNVGIFQEGGLGPETVDQLAELASQRPGPGPSRH